MKERVLAHMKSNNPFLLTGTKLKSKGKTRDQNMRQNQKPKKPKKTLKKSKKLSLITARRFLEERSGKDIGNPRLMRLLVTGTREKVDGHLSGAAGHLLGPAGKWD